VKLYLKKPHISLFQDACREALLDADQLLLGPDYAVSDEQFKIITDALMNQFCESLGADSEPSAHGAIIDSFIGFLYMQHPSFDKGDLSEVLTGHSRSEGVSVKLSFTKPQASLFREACREASLSVDELLAGCEYWVSDERLNRILDALANQQGTLVDELRTLLLDACYEDALR